MSLTQIKEESLVTTREITKKIKLSGILDMPGVHDFLGEEVVSFSNLIHEDLKNHKSDEVAQRALHRLYKNFQLELENTPERFKVFRAIHESVQKHYHPGPGMFPNFKYPGEEHHARKDRMTIDLFCRDGGMDSISILTNSAFIRPFVTYFREGLVPRTVGYVGSVRADSVARTVCERESEFRAAMMHQFIGDRDIAKFHSRMVSAILKQGEVSIRPDARKDLIMDFILKIPRVLDAEIKALDNFFAKIDTLDAMYDRWVDEGYFQSIVDSLKSLRCNISNLRDRYDEFQRELIYYPKGYSEVLTLAVAASKYVPSISLLIDIVLLLRVSTGSVERITSRHYLDDVNEVADCIVSFLREFREARVPSVLSQPFPSGIL